MTKRGRKPDPNIIREGPCGECGTWMVYTKDQAYRATYGVYAPMCSKECVLKRQRKGGLCGQSKFKEGPTHPNWVDGRGSKDAVNRVIDHLTKYGNASTPELRTVLGECSYSTVSRARREAGLPLRPKRKHGFYSNEVKQVRNLMASIRRFIKEGADQ